MFNGNFVNRQAAHLATRLEKEAGNDSAAQIRRGWQLVLCRPPESRELKIMQRFLVEEAAARSAEPKAGTKPPAESVARRRALIQFLPRVAQYERVRVSQLRVPPMKTTSARLGPNATPCDRTRRKFLRESCGGFAGLALIDLLSRDGFFTNNASAADSMAGHPLAPRAPHFPTQAKHCIFLFMNGAPSQVDTFDPKPALQKHAGKPYSGKAKVGSNGRPIGYLTPSFFEFKRHGRSGLEISDIFPHTAQHADDICVIRSLQTDTAAHASGCLQMNTGSVLIGKPSLGSWLSYGTGDRERQPPQLRRHDRPARRADRQCLKLDRRVHAGPLSGNIVPQPGDAITRPLDTRRNQRAHAATRARSAHSSQPRSSQEEPEPVGTHRPHPFLRTRLQDADVGGRGR